jgi:hypothetical protein
MDFAKFRRIVTTDAQWIPEDASHPDGPAFLLAPFWSQAWTRARDAKLQTPKYRPLMEEQRRQHRHQNVLLEEAPPLPLIQQQELDRLQAELDQELTAETVILDWRGQTHNGVDVPYNVETVRENLRYSAFRDFIAAMAPPLRQEADSAKNSGTASGGH